MNGDCFKAVLAKYLRLTVVDRKKKFRNIVLGKQLRNTVFFDFFRIQFFKRRVPAFLGLCNTTALEVDLCRTVRRSLRCWRCCFCCWCCPCSYCCCRFPGASPCSRGSCREAPSVHDLVVCRRWSRNTPRSPTTSNWVLLRRPAACCRVLENWRRPGEIKNKNNNNSDTNKTENNIIDSDFLISTE